MTFAIFALAAVGMYALALFASRGNRRHGRASSDTGVAYVDGGGTSCDTSDAGCGDGGGD